MPKIILPRTNEDLIRFFETITRILLEDQAVGLQYLDAAWTAHANTFSPAFQTKVRGLSTAQHRRAKETEERKAKITELQAYVRDFLIVLKRMIIREKLPRHLFTFYGLPESGQIPNPLTTNEVLSWAEKIVKGHADAVAAGYPAMCNPTAAQVSALLAQAKTEGAEISATERDLDMALDEVEALRAEGYALAKDAEQQLNFHLRKLAPSDRRRIMRRYGFHYREPVSKTPVPVDPVA